jgi:hypothetical protein
VGYTKYYSVNKYAYLVKLRGTTNVSKDSRRLSAFLTEYLLNIRRYSETVLTNVVNT